MIKIRFFKCIQIFETQFKQCVVSIYYISVKLKSTFNFRKRLLLTARVLYDTHNINKHKQSDKLKMMK